MRVLTKIKLSFILSSICLLSGVANAASISITPNSDYNDGIALSPNDSSPKLYTNGYQQWQYQLCIQKQPSYPCENSEGIKALMLSNSKAISFQYTYGDESGVVYLENDFQQAKPNSISVSLQKNIYRQGLYNEQTLSAPSVEPQSNSAGGFNIYISVGENTSSASSVIITPVYEGSDGMPSDGMPNTILLQDPPESDGNGNTLVASTEENMMYHNLDFTSKIYSELAAYVDENGYPIQSPGFPGQVTMNMYKITGIKSLKAGSQTVPCVSDCQLSHKGNPMPFVDIDALHIISTSDESEVVNPLSLMNAFGEIVEENGAYFDQAYSCTNYLPPLAMQSSKLGKAVIEQKNGSFPWFSAYGIPLAKQKLIKNDASTVTCDEEGSSLPIDYANTDPQIMLFFIGSSQNLGQRDMTRWNSPQMRYWHFLSNLHGPTYGPVRNRNLGEAYQQTYDNFADKAAYNVSYNYKGRDAFGNNFSVPVEFWSVATSDGLEFTNQNPDQSTQPSQSK